MKSIRRRRLSVRKRLSVLVVLMLVVSVNLTAQSATQLPTEKNDSENAAVLREPQQVGRNSDLTEFADANSSLEGPSTTVKTELLTKTFTDLAAALCKNQEPQQVLAGVLSIVYGDQLSTKHYGKINTKSAAPRGDQKRIFISLGKRDGYHAREIADYFSELLHIPGRLVDDIDVAQQFSLVSLPVASARKAIELSKSNKKIPHMHYDDKEEDRGSRRTRKAAFADSPARGKRDSAKTARAPRGRLNAKTNKPNVHVQAERSSSRKNGGAAAYKKSNKKAERF